MAVSVPRARRVVGIVTSQQQACGPWPPRGAQASARNALLFLDRGCRSPATEWLRRSRSTSIATQRAPVLSDLKVGGVCKRDRTNESRTSRVLQDARNPSYWLEPGGTGMGRAHLDGDSSGIYVHAPEPECPRRRQVPQRAGAAGRLRGREPVRLRHREDDRDGSRRTARRRATAVRVGGSVQAPGPRHRRLLRERHGPRLPGRSLPAARPTCHGGRAEGPVPRARPRRGLRGDGRRRRRGGRGVRGRGNRVDAGRVRPGETGPRSRRDLGDRHHLRRPGHPAPPHQRPKVTTLAFPGPAPSGRRVNLLAHQLVPLLHGAACRPGATHQPPGEHPRDPDRDRRALAGTGPHAGELTADAAPQPVGPPAWVGSANDGYQRVAFEATIPLPNMLSQGMVYF